MNRQTKVVRVICIILAGLMVLGAATIVISLLAGTGHVH